MQSHWKQAGKEGEIECEKGIKGVRGVERGEMRRGDYLQQKKEIYVLNC